MRRDYNYEGTIYVDYNEREVEVKIKASAYVYQERQTCYDPAYDEAVVDDAEIIEAHYTDTNEPAEIDELYDAVYRYLDDHFWDYFNDDDNYDYDDSGMDCVDRWNVAHGIEV
jgi:hypothetical protein